MLPALTAEGAARLLAGLCVYCGQPMPPDASLVQIYCSPKHSAFARRDAKRLAVDRRREARRRRWRRDPDEERQVDRPSDAEAEQARHQARELRQRADELRQQAMAALAHAARLEQSARTLEAAAAGQLDLFEGPGQLLTRGQVLHPSLSGASS